MAARGAGAAAGEWAHLVAAFKEGLNEAGFVEGQNVAIEYRWAEGRSDWVPAMAADLVHRQVAVIAAGGTASALAARAATTTVPIVFTTGGDPVREGLVASFNRPGGNVTGVSFLTALLAAKRLELLRQFVPKATTIAHLVNPNIPNTEADRKEVQAAAQVVGQQLLALDVSSERQIEAAFATLVQRGAGALQIGTGAFWLSQRERVVALAARHRIPAMYPLREYVAAGGLMSYGPSITAKHTAAKDVSLLGRIAPTGFDPNGRLEIKSLEADQDWFLKLGLQQGRADLGRVIDYQYLDYAVSRLGKR